MLFVPREPFPAALPGLAPPRAVPSDLVVAAASRILPADILQKLILLAIFVLACAGAAALLDREPLLARLAAGVFYAWNPYVAERLIIGHWALLLGYAALPWTLRAVLAPDLLSRRGAARLFLALLPAVIGGFAALSIAALLAIPAAAFTGNPRPARPVEQRGCGTLTGRAIRLPHPRGCRAALAGDPRRAAPTGDPRRAALAGDPRRLVLVLAALTIGSLPWLIPSLLHPVYVDPASIAAFAARADTPFGSLGSLLMLGGAWNAQTVPQAYGGPWSALWLAAVILALAAYLLRTRTHPRWPGLGTAAIVGLLIAAAGITTPGRDLLRSLIAAFPGFAVLRDAQQFVAPLALLESLGLALAVAAARNPAPLRRKAPTPKRPALAHQAATPSTRPTPADPAATPSDHPLHRDPPGTASERPARADLAGTLLGVLALLAPVLLLPGLAWGAAGRLRPAWYPATWLSAAQTLDASPAPGSVLLLPWATYRTPSWNHGETVIDPWTHLLSRPLIWNDGTRVGSVALLPDDPRARSLNVAIDGTGPLTATLRAAGVRFVLDDADGLGSQVAARLPGSVIIINLPGLTVYQLPG
jgi:hypothetical protein